MFYRSIAAAAVATLALSGCATPPPPAPVQVDLFNEGIAKTCSYSPVQPKSGETVEATITMTNDGWCAFRATESEGKAYELGLVRQRPMHGELLIRKWNGETRVELYPAAGYVGTESFTVALRPTTGADAVVHVVATVTKGDGSSATPPEPVEETPAASRTRSTRRAPAKK